MNAFNVKTAVREHVDSLRFRVPMGAATRVLEG